MNSVALHAQPQDSELDYVQWALTVNCGAELFCQSVCKDLVCIHAENEFSSAPLFRQTQKCHSFALKRQSYALIIILQMGFKLKRDFHLNNLPSSYNF
jgi:hypothetical protein